MFDKMPRDLEDQAGAAAAATLNDGGEAEVISGCIAA
jgi:hypothetical protein